MDYKPTGDVQGLPPCEHGGDVWRARRETGSQVILDFSSNVNPLGPSPKVMDAIRKNLWRIPIYPDPSSVDLARRLADYIGTIGSQNIIVGNGSTELIYLFADAFLSEGDHVLIPCPTFAEYDRAVRRVGARSVPVPLTEDYRLDLGSIHRSIKSRAKAIFICNPNNPTSILIPRDDLYELLNLAGKREILVFLDEAYIEFVDDQKRHSLAGDVREMNNLFVLRSLTKIFGLAGLRIGYGVASSEMIESISDAKTPWNINCLAEVAALAALTDPEHLRKAQSLIKEERPFLEEGLGEIDGIKSLHGDANFILLDTRGSAMKGSEIKEKLLLHGILIRDCGSFKGLDDYYVRLAVRGRKDNMRLVTALREVVSSR